MIACPKPTEEQYKQAMSDNMLAYLRSGMDKDAIRCLENGANPNSRYPDGRTALMIAVPHLKPVKSLVEKGADILAKNSRGIDAYYYAKMEKSTACMEFLDGELAKKIQEIGKD